MGDWLSIIRNRLEETMETSTHPNTRRIQIVMSSVKDKAALSAAAQSWSERYGDERRSPLSAWIRMILNKAARQELGGKA